MMTPQHCSEDMKIPVSVIDFDDRSRQWACEAWRVGNNLATDLFVKATIALLHGSEDVYQGAVRYRWLIGPHGDMAEVDCQLSFFPLV